MKRTLIFCFSFIMLLHLKPAAQPFNLNERVQPIELNLVDYMKTDSMAKGRINATQITQTSDTMYFFVKGLSIYSPVYFGITTDSSAGNIKVNLNKDNWHMISQTGETGDKKHWETNFKTEGDFGIMIIPETKPADYSLVVWVGDEAKEVGIPSIFKNDKSSATTSASGKGNFFKNNLIYIIIGLLVVIIGFLFLKLKRKK